MNPVFIVQFIKVMQKLFGEIKYITSILSFCIPRCVLIKLGNIRTINTAYIICSFYLNY
jgi:hypothetical protein